MIDVEIKINKLDLTGGRKEVERLRSDFRVHYALKLSDKSYNGSKRITATSNKAVWTDEEGNEQCEAKCSMEMKNLTIAALENHKRKAEEKGISCRLDYEDDPGVLPHSDQMWICMWAYAENEIKNQLLAIKDKSDQSKLGHQTRTDNILAQKWQTGDTDDSKDKFWKYRARRAVMETLEKWSEKKSI